MRISRTNTISHQHRCRLSCRWQRLREPQHFLQLQRDLHQLLRHQTLTCCVAAAHTPSLELQNKQFPGAELQYRKADPDRRNWTTRAFHHTDTHLRSLSDPVLKKKTKAIVASADITSVLAEYSLHPPFLLFTIFTVSPTANEKKPLIFTLISNSFSCRHDKRIGRMFSVF